MRKEEDVVIIGAGISGCAAAQALQEHEVSYSLLEKNVEPGGLTRSISVGDASFDYTGHYLHLIRCNSPEDIPYAKQINEEWQQIKRKSFVYLNEKLIPTPFQYNLFALPIKIRDRCWEDFCNRPLIKNANSFKEYLLSGFGAGICEVFLFPYNEKQMARPLEDISVEKVNRFFPRPDKTKIERGFKGQSKRSDAGYNEYFWYPKYNGIGLLAKGLAKDLANLNTCCTVEKIDLHKKYLYTSQGSIKYKRLITSMPLKKFCYITNNPKLRSLARLLTHNRVLCLNLHLKGNFYEYFNKCHWIYFPDKDIPFYRLGFYPHFNSTFVPSGQTTLYIEVAYDSNESLPSQNNVINEVFCFLENLGWIKKNDCLGIVANWIDYAYVHFTENRNKTVCQIMKILKDYDVYPIGRYGLWDYISMEDSIFSGIEVARSLINS